MAINKNDPAYRQYITECKMLSEKYLALEDALRAKYPQAQGFDHPAGRELRDLDLHHNMKLKDLQKKYSFLFGSDKNI